MTPPLGPLEFTLDDVQWLKGLSTEQALNVVNSINRLLAERLGNVPMTFTADGKTYYCIEKLEGK